MKLTAMAGEYGRLFRKVVQRVTVGEVVGELVAAKRQDKVSQRYLLQLQSSLNRFAAKFPGPSSTSPGRKSTPGCAAWKSRRSTCGRGSSRCRAPVR